jgi:hypothetical protein
VDQARVGRGEDEAAAEHIEPLPLTIIFVDRDRGTDPLPDGRGGSASTIVKDVRWSSGQQQDIAGFQCSGGLPIGSFKDCRASENDVVGDFSWLRNRILKPPWRREETSVLGSPRDGDDF